MTDKTQAEPVYMGVEEFREIMRLLDLNIERDAAMLCVSKNTLYIYQSGRRPIPAHFAALLRIMLYQRQDPASVMALGYPLSQSQPKSAPAR